MAPLINGCWHLSQRELPGLRSLDGRQCIRRDQEAEGIKPSCHGRPQNREQNCHGGWGFAGFGRFAKAKCHQRLTSDSLIRKCIFQSGHPENIQVLRPARCESSMQQHGDIQETPKRETGSSGGAQQQVS